MNKKVRLVLVQKMINNTMEIDSISFKEVSVLQNKRKNNIYQ